MASVHIIGSSGFRSTSEEDNMSEQDRYLTHAREILADYEAGKMPAGSAVDWARQILGVQAEAQPISLQEMNAAAAKTLQDPDASPEAKDRARAILAVASGVPLDLAVKAAELKIDVTAFLKACADQKLDPVTALTAEIDNQKVIERTSARSHVLDFRQAAG